MGLSRRLVEKHRIPYHEKKLGQQFCNASSRAIIEMLIAECAGAGVETFFFFCNCTVRDIQKPDTYHLSTSQG